MSRRLSAAATTGAAASANKAGASGQLATGERDRAAQRFLDEIVPAGAGKVRPGDTDLA
jgi:hypothetical protein